jgi:hypothetical protein
MQNIFSVEKFVFPYTYKFPGQASDEVILFIARENEVLLWWRRAQVLGFSLALLLVSMIAQWLLRGLFPKVTEVLWGLCTVGAFLVLILGWWWVTAVWKKSIFAVSTKRLIKFIYTTPYNRHTLSLPLEMIVDTGSYTKGLLQAVFKLGTFTARSSASSSGAATDEPERVNKKYFYLENISMAEDLQHYINKLLQAVRHKAEILDTFRPFLPHLKGAERKEFMQQYPEFWS